LAAEISSAQIIVRRRSKAGKIVVGNGELSMSLRCYSVTGVKCAIGDDSGAKSGDGSARADSDATRNLTGPGIGDSGRAQDGELLGRSERLRISLSGESGQGSKGENSGDKPKTK
jgi:hypothetical protein